jgi:Stigma-specific protein, Stig1
MKSSLLVALVGSVAFSFFGVACGDGEPDTSGVGGGGGEVAMGGEPGSGGSPSCASSQEACDGLCTNLRSDPENCGTCGTTCGASESCVRGSCVRVGCSTGQVECDGSCTSLQTDPLHCGNCGTACDAGELCASGACVATCPVGQLPCDGTCINPATDRQYCGATDCNEAAQGGAGGGGDGEACSSEELCVDGTCQRTCAGDELVCGGRCVDPLSSSNFCGATDCSANETSGEACASGQACQDGECSFACPGTQVACGGQCVDPQTNRNYCGASTCADDATDGEVCPSGQVCAAGVCETSCPQGQVACGGECIKPATDPTYCGATTCADDATDGESCDTASGEVCANGLCDTSCPPGQLVCSGACVNPNTDRGFCGATDCDGGDATDGSVCGSGEVCANGLCDTSCLPGQLVCGGACVNPNTDRSFCGATDCDGGDATDGSACASGEVCVGGACETSCPTGQLVCGGGCISPDTSREYCGATDCEAGDTTDGETCGSGQVCSSGVCTTSCAANQVDCSGTCIDPETNRDYCGVDANCAGGDVCAGGEVCGAGQCVPTCPSGTFECTGSCVNPLTSNQLCGASDCAGTGGQVCSTGQACVSGECVAYVQWQTAERIDQSNFPATTEQYLATDSAGNAVLVFRQEVDGTGDDSLRAYGSYFSVSTGSWTAPVLLDTRANKVQSIHVDMNDAGVAVATWTMQTGATSTTVVASRFSGGTWGAPVDIDGPIAEFPKVYVDNLGQGAIVYSKDVDNVFNASSPTYQVYGAVLTTSSTVASRTALSDFAGAAYQATGQRISGNSAGKGMAVYLSAVSPRNIYAVRYDSSTGFGTAATKTQLNAALVTGTRCSTADVAVDPAGKAYAVWSLTSALYRPVGTGVSFPLVGNIHSAVFDGATWGSDVTVTSFSDTAVDPRVSATLGAVGLTYQRYSTTATSTAPTTYQIYGQRYVGGAWVDQHLLDSSAFSGPQPLPNVGVSGTGDIHFVWGDGPVAAAARYSAQSAAWSPQEDLSAGGPGSGQAQWPVLASTPTVTMFASWVQPVTGLSGVHVMVSRYE